jgi:uncharacterized protein YndB with AHSA1/START domain
MATTQSVPQLMLEIRRTFAAPRERVFAAWTEQEQYAKWMCRVRPDSNVECLELDLRPGGTFRVKNHYPNGDTFLLRGQYREILPPEKLVFTWEWEKAPFCPAGETLVTVNFLKHGDQTEVVLTHTGFLDIEDRERHNHGWNACFDSLAAIL